MYNFDLEQAKSIYINAIKHPYGDAHYDSVDKIRRHLSRTRYNLNNDATYALLDKDLTKAKFEEQLFIATTHMITRAFIATQAVRTEHDYNGGLVPGLRYQAAENLLNLLKKHADAIENYPDALDTDQYHSTLLDFVMTEYRSGRINTYHDVLKVNYAVHIIEEFRELTDHALNTEDTNDRDHCLSHAAERTKRINDLMNDLRKDQKVEVLQRTNQTEKSLRNSRKTLAFTFARYAVTHDAIPKQRPVFLWYQRALEELDEAGVNLHAKSTYKAIGMDFQTFWNNYSKQIEWLKSQSHLYDMPERIYTLIPKP